MKIRKRLLAMVVGVKFKTGFMFACCLFFFIIYKFDKCAVKNLTLILLIGHTNLFSFSRINIIFSILCLLSSIYKYINLVRNITKNIVTNAYFVTCNFVTTSDVIFIVYILFPLRASLIFPSET